MTLVTGSERKSSTHCFRTTALINSVVVIVIVIPGQKNESKLLAARPIAVLSKTEASNDYRFIPVPAHA